MTAVRTISDVALLVAAVLGYWSWKRYRRLEFKDQFDAAIGQRLRVIRRVCVSMLIAGFATVLCVALWLPHHDPWTLIGFLIGLVLELAAFGVGWNIPAVRDELWLRSVGNPNVTKEKLERMTSIGRASTINVPIALLSAVALLLVLYLWK